MSPVTASSETCPFTYWWGLLRVQLPSYGVHVSKVQAFRDQLYSSLPGWRLGICLLLRHQQPVYRCHGTVCPIPFCGVMDDATVRARVDEQVARSVRRSLAVLGLNWHCDLRHLSPLEMLDLYCQSKQTKS